MYNSDIHDMKLSTSANSGKSLLDKSADLHELSQQMKVNIAQLKSQLGLKTKDDDDAFKAIEELTSFGRNFHSELDSKEDELKQMQNDIANLQGQYMRLNNQSESFSSSPRNFNGSSLFESTGIIGIQSKHSAFSPRFSSSSLSEKDFRFRRGSGRLSEPDVMSSFHRRETGNTRTMREKLDEDRRRKSSSSLSSAKSSPRNMKQSLSSSSNYDRRSNGRSSRDIPDIAENEMSYTDRSKRRNRGSQSSGQSSRSVNPRKKDDISSVRYLQMSSKSNGPVLKLKSSPRQRPKDDIKPQPRQRAEVEVEVESVYGSSNDEASSSEYKETSSSENEEPEREERVVERRSESKKKYPPKSNKFEEVEKKLLLLQQRCDLLENENENIKKEQKTKNNIKIADLKHRNSELVNIAKRLGQKAKTLQAQSEKKTNAVANGTHELTQQKKNFLKLRTRMETEHSKMLAEKDHQLDMSKKQIDDLKKSLRQANAFKLSGNGDEVLSASLKQSQKESLQLQKLAAAGNKKIIIRSLSTPVTARQKILEESNRNLRRQLAALEENYRKACRGETEEDIKEQYESLTEEYDTLKKESNATKIQIVNLESQLQIAKVEASDTSLQLNELNISFNQIQEEYNTVHEQLAVAIKERDNAIHLCRENAIKLKEMEIYIKNINENGANGDVINNNQMQKMEKSNDNAVSQYQIALEKLQTKVSELEKQCKEQNETNRLLNEQLMKLMTNNRSSNSSQTAHVESTIANTNNNDSPMREPLSSPERGLDNRASPNVKEEINANKVTASSNPQQTRPDIQPNQQPVGNEDTEVEDFVEEELLPVMDNNEGKLRVYIAKYTYNPYEGPNDCPETELPLVAGDYVYVYGQMDEDGFFEGELMNGRRGLVPSNFLEPVHDNASPFATKVLSKQENASSMPKCTSSEISQSESIISSLTSQASSRVSHKGDISDTNSPVLIHGVLPYPKKLCVDKQLSHSLIIGWVPPSLSEGELIDEYHIIVNGEFRTAVSGNKQKAVVENIHHEQTYRISVCAVSQWGISDENLCVLSHGRGVNLSPTMVRMEKIGATTARVAWAPSSSGLSTVVTVEEEGIERFSPQVRNLGPMTHIVSPPLYRFTFGNLRPNVSYKVTVNAKGSTEVVRNYTRFTTPEAGPPDPPLSVQVEECQNTNYLLITWLPVTLNTMGTSNGVVVKGYSIHVGDTEVCEVNSATVDQCTVRPQTLADALSKQMSMCPAKTHRLSKPSSAGPRWNKHVPPSVTVKSHAVNGQESDHSDPYLITEGLFRRLVKLITENEKLSHVNHGNESPASQESSKGHKRPPFMHRRESTDVDVSFSSDISMPGLQNTSKVEDDDRGRRSGASSRNLTNHKSNMNKTKILQQTRVVPSIEITHDTSSDEDATNQNGVASRSSSCKSVNKENSEHFTHGRKISGEKLKGIHSASKTKVNEVTGGHKGSDNDDAASVSSSHTSSSTGGGALKHSKQKAAHRTIQAYKLQRGESAEYSNPEDYMPSYKHNSSRNLTPSDTEKKTSLKRTPEQVRQHRQQQRHHHHHNMRQGTRRPHSVTSDEHSQGSHHSRSSSRNSHNHFHPKKSNGRPSVPRQLTLSSQSGSELASEVEPSYPVDKSRLSLFVALYDYDPRHMSPNTDTFDEELIFTEGQLIKVYGDKDDDGFYYGETHIGTRGFVPCNMVSEVEVESLQMLHDLHERGHLPSASPDEEEQDVSDGKDTGLNENDISQQQAAKKNVRYFMALFDYDPQNLSPNIDVDVEVPFSRGDIIAVRGEMDEDGFFKGKLKDKEGLIPSNFLEEISEQQVAALQQKSNQTTKPKPSVVESPIPKPRPNHANNVMHNSRNDYASASNNTMPLHKVDNAGSPRKKGGFISKGKKLFKKLGGSQDGKSKR